jgi:phosphate transport system ATP-binding protein
VLRPQVLLLDEPCSALDPIASGVIEDLIISLKGFYTVVMVTHDMAQARRMADRVVVFGHDGMCGRHLEDGPCEAIFTKPSDARTAAYLAGRRL